MASRIEAALAFEGMTPKPGLVIMDIFITQALLKHSVGSFVEFGTWKGRTAALFAKHLNTDRWLHAVERSDYLEIERIKELSHRVTWHKSDSEQFCAQKIQGIAPIIATHHDASHFFNNVFVELLAVLPLMHRGGIIILDDFNDVYSQVRAAYYYLRFALNFPYEILLIGYNKCILVHEKEFSDYEKFVLDSLHSSLTHAGLNCRLIRTETHEHSRCFSVSAKVNPNDPDYYGTNTYGDRYYRPSVGALKRRPKVVQD